MGRALKESQVAPGMGGFPSFLPSPTPQGTSIAAACSMGFRECGASCPCEMVGGWGGSFL